MPMQTEKQTKKRPNLDILCLNVTNGNRNMLVPWYLMSSYLYYCEDISILSDELYDVLCKRLHKHWGIVKHRHKHIIQQQYLVAGTGYYLSEKEYPNICKGAALRLLSRDSGTLF